MAQTLTEIKAALAELELTPRKQRGQNFLSERGSIGVICQFASVSSADHVVEIGPGLGAISLDLAGQAASYLAVEIEARFVERLRPKLAQFPSAMIINADICTIRLESDPRFNAAPLTIVSNVPYSLSTEILLWIVRNRRRVNRASLLLQREFAERVAAHPGGKDYGSLSVLAELHADVRLGPTISGHCFYPRADVESRLVELNFLPAPRFDVGDGSEFESLVRACFSHRRKTLLNSLADSGLCGSKADLETMLARAVIRPDRRAETLNLREFIDIFNSWKAGLAR